MSGRWRLPVVGAALLVLVGCGAAPVSSAGSADPSLRVALMSVDTSLAHGHYALARRTLAKLIDGARAAERSGSISASAADRIISAARELLATLPHTTAAPTIEQLPSQPTASSARPSPTPTKTATTRPTRKPQPPAPQPTPTLAPSPTPTPEPSPTGPPSSGMVSPSP